METTDKLAIQELLSRAAYGYDEHDLDMVEKCFAPEASMVVRIANSDDVGPFKGREAIMKLMADSMSGQTDKRRHVITNVFFEAEGNADVTVVSYVTLFGTENGKNRLITTGVYRDKVIKVDSDWLISVRDLGLDLPY
jgi:hypothetical protein